MTIYKGLTGRQLEILYALKRSEGNAKEAARSLGIGPKYVRQAVRVAEARIGVVLDMVRARRDPRKGRPKREPILD